MGFGEAGSSMLAEAALEWRQDVAPGPLTLTTIVSANFPPVRQPLDFPGSEPYLPALLQKGLP